MPKSKVDPRIQLLLELLGQGYDHPAWHGPNLRGALRNVSLQLALWRPAPHRHCIWEIALHAAYWKYAARRKLTAEPRRGGFPGRPAGWPALPPKPSRAAWSGALKELNSQHQRLLEAVSQFAPRRLDTRLPGSRFTASQWTMGIAAHDLYHAGQVRLLIQLARELAPD